MEYGAVLIVSVDEPTIGRQAAGMAKEITSVGKMEEKVQYPAGSHAQDGRLTPATEIRPR